VVLAIAAADVEDAKAPMALTLEPAL
jgi:hypothetical protein